MSAPPYNNDLQTPSRSNGLIAVVIILIIALLCSLGALAITSLTASAQRSAAVDEAHKNGYAQGYDEGYAVGYKEACENEESLWTTDEVQEVYIYAFQKGYSNCKNGVWDQITENYINNYEFGIVEELFFERFFE